MATRLRPLAHVSIADQVISTALMLCLADRVETLQGDPRRSVNDEGSRRQVVSYGNRLLCDNIGGELRHRWGSTKLYRAYYQDYRAFLSRPEVTAESFETAEGRRLYVVHSDLRQFYDRVRPSLLAKAINNIRHSGDDPRFFTLAETVLNWSWHSRDEKDLAFYSEQADLDDFRRVALPQGLVASGFFANIVLQSFDKALRNAISTEIAPRIVIADACRYVDDLRILIAVEPHKDISLLDIGATVSDWLSQILNQNAPGLMISAEKTQIAALGGDERPLVRQSTKMKRIQSAVSGGFDALGGQEILDTIQGLIRTQESLCNRDDNSWRLSPVPDVGDETVARFGAARYRTTFRSIRPLLQDNEMAVGFETGKDDKLPNGWVRGVRTRLELDDDARVFALGLIQRWIDDPSNVRLLRIGLDIWPDVELVREVLSILRPYTEKGSKRKAQQRVAWYCLVELLRAGATETGLVPDTESLPSRIDIGSYREELQQEAMRLVMLPEPTIPWYLRQQALLFLAAFDPARAPVKRIGSGPETRHYRELIRFLRGEGDRLRNSDFATLAVIARRSFVNQERAIELTRSGLNSSRKRQIAQRDPSFLIELIDTGSDVVVDLPARVREDLCRVSESDEEDQNTLVKAVIGTHPRGPLRNELSILNFALAFLKESRQLEPHIAVITPSQVKLVLSNENGIAKVIDLRILRSRAKVSGSLYEVPAWCEAEGRWRFQLGFLLRFILSGQPDFTRPVRNLNWKERASVYRPPENSWYQRLYGLYSAQPAFGDDWVPITDWMEQFVLALLKWPGCRAPEGFDWIEKGIDEAIRTIGGRVSHLEQMRGRATGALILPLIANRPTFKNLKRPLRACIVQTAIPEVDDFDKKDLSLDNPVVRRRHRNHLAAALAAVERMLALRETHKGSEGRLDWLILPELAAHPNDVHKHLVPFARAHRAIILTGITYECIFPGQPLVNSALWIIPEWSDDHGLQIRTRRQGKAYLAQSEKTFNDSTMRLQGFRPCQWLIGYPWSAEPEDRPVWLTSSVCYDATDLALAADLRNVADVYAIPAFNKDVKTFDQMALALHYHMFQLVVVANSGQYGGSNAYWPSQDTFRRQIFHLHGQPQASIAFLEIDDVEAFLDRDNRVTSTLSRKNTASTSGWKFPPAGLVRK